ncbi:MAG: type IV secretion system protein VirB10 [Pseudomonadota bacterium]
MTDASKMSLGQEASDDTSFDRGMPSVSHKGNSALFQNFALGGIIILTVFALVGVNGGFSSEKENTTIVKESTNQILNRLGPAPNPPEPAPVIKKIEPIEPEIINTGFLTPPPPSLNYNADETSPYIRKRESNLLAFGEVSKASVSEVNNLDSSNALVPVNKADGLAAKLENTALSGARAGLMTDRNFFITQGTFLDCALETALSSDVPGMTSCRMTRDVYSTNGKVLLLERGSKITGEYQSGVKRGQARIFVLWNRVETPNGVIINLNSPGTDSLGRSGFNGLIDTHFAERFGGAILLSMIDYLGSYAANKASSGNGDTIALGGAAQAAQDAASIALQNSIDIPPTLIKHQGDSISIFVARDLDFRGVYDLKFRE